jgi:hypothetical protein
MTKMTVTLPILDIFFSVVLFFLSTLLLYQGWRICFTGKKEPLFPYIIAKFLANSIDKEQEFLKKTSHLRTSSFLILQGVSALVGGAFGVTLSIVFIINIMARIEEIY